MCKQTVADGEDVSLIKVKQVLYELVWHTICGRLKSDTAIASLSQVMVCDMKKALPYVMYCSGRIYCKSMMNVAGISQRVAFSAGRCVERYW